MEELGIISGLARFSYTISDGRGGETTSSSQGIFVNVKPKDDPAIFAGDLTGAVTEAEDSVSTPGLLLTTSGMATIDDPDATIPREVDRLEVFVAETIAGSYGSLTIAADGAWTYEVENDLAAIQALDTGDMLQDSVTVRQASLFSSGIEFGTATTDIVIDIWGTDEWLG